MANLQPIEVIEEDAADLQFPKDSFSGAVQELSVHPTLRTCYTCSEVLKEPYVRCADCRNISICTSCFASGAECNPHMNSHDYVVIRNEFSLFEDPAWTAKEEVELLDALLDCGFGNWNDISRQIQTHTAEECERHYLSCYVNSQPLPGLPKFRESTVIRRSAPISFFDPRLGDIDEPPRYSVSSVGYRSLSGYNAGRSDFEIEFDNFAEEDLCILDFEMFREKDEYHELGQALQSAIVSRYNFRLKERMRRKKVIRDHGLIVARKAVTWQQRYEQALTRQSVDRFLRFAQLLKGMHLDLIMEGLKHAFELQQRISRLCEVRENGITTFRGSQLYHKLRQNRENYLKERKMYLSSPEYCWKTVLDIPSSIAPVICNPRRPAPPLDIVGLPMYERLNTAERELCSVSRIVPESYLMFKNILITEYKRNGSLKLAQARTLIKIDVNKTRKLYDFLLKEGYITQ